MEINILTFLQDTLSFLNCQSKFDPIILTGKIWTDGKVQIRMNRDDSLRGFEQTHGARAGTKKTKRDTEKTKMLKLDLVQPEKRRNLLTHKFFLLLTTYLISEPRLHENSERNPFTISKSRHNSYHYMAVHISPP